MNIFDAPMATNYAAVQFSKLIQLSSGLVEKQASQYLIPVYCLS